MRPPGDLTADAYRVLPTIRDGFVKIRDRRWPADEGADESGGEGRPGEAPAGMTAEAAEIVVRTPYAQTYDRASARSWERREIHDG